MSDLSLRDAAGLDALPPAPMESSATEAHNLSPAALLAASEPVGSAYSAVVLAGLVRFLDVALLMATGTLLYFGYVVPDNGFDWYYIVAIAAIASTAMIAFEAADVYRIKAFRRPGRTFLRIVPAFTLVFFIGTAVAFFAKFEGMFSRVWLASFYVCGLASIFLLRFAVRSVLRRWTVQGRLERRAVVVGGGETGALLVEMLRAEKACDIRLLGLFDDRDDARSPSVCGGLPKLGSVDQLVEFARRTRVDLVLFTLPISAERRILQMLKKLWVLPVDIRLSAHSNQLQFRPRAYSYIGSVPVLDVFDKPITDWDIVVKWLFDKLVGGLLLLGAAPVMAFIALAIRFDSRGPVLFKQKRYGFNNELIEVYKFRSMYVDQCDPTAKKLVTKGDPRVTRVGRFIRRTSLDELPQLINVVIKGNLSLVGPRPHAVHAKAEDRLYDEAVDGYFARHRVKPGITGWAQINGWRGETDTHEKIQRRVEHDLYYIENWSVLLDFYILAKTPFALAKSENAY